MYRNVSFILCESEDERERERKIANQLYKTERANCRRERRQRRRVNGEEWGWMA